jgi:PAS domain S-box-containing protein
MSSVRIDSLDSFTLSNQQRFKTLDRRIFFAIFAPTSVAILLALGVAYLALSGQPDGNVYLFRLALGAAFFFIILSGLAWVSSARISSYLQQTLEASEADQDATQFAQHSSDERKLHDELTIFKDIFDDAPIAYHELKADGTLTRINRTELAMLGYTADEMIGHHASEFILEKGSRDAIARKLAGEIPLKAYERHFICKDGSLLPALMEDRLIRNAEGSVFGIRTTIQDMRAHKKVEEALARERDLLYSLMDNIPDCIYFKDMQGAFIKINSALADLLGLPSPAEAIGKTDFDFYTEEVAKDSYAAEQNFILAGKPLIGRVEQVIKPDGEARWMLTTKVPIKHKDGHFTGLVGISKDITERKHAEEALEHSLEAFLEVVDSVSKGDLTRRGSEGDDTLGRIAKAINKMLDDFSDMLTQVKQMGLLVSTSAVQIHAASSQIAVGAQRQTEETANISSSINEMAASMSQVSQNANTSADAAKTALNKAALGNQSAFDTSEAMLQIDHAVQLTAEKMRLLEERSSKISEVMDLIDEIASQTNLLALNATIEAAHAGEAGLGFSVVADEIRKLSDRTAKATKDVSKLITAIQFETSQALDTMENGTQRVKEGRLLAEHARQALNDISTAVKQSAELIEEISVASDEHARVTRELANVMHTVSDITYETSASAHETTCTIKGMVDLSDQLNGSILQFKIKAS